MEEPAKELKKAQELPMPPLRSPSGKRGIKIGDGKMLAPKAAVLKLMKDPLDLQDNTQQETSWPKGELSLDEGKKNREIWRKGMLERLRKQKVPRGHWEDVGSGNFQGLMSFSAPFEVRMAVLKDMGKNEVDEWLYQEMKRYYDIGPSIDN